MLSPTPRSALLLTLTLLAAILPACSSLDAEYNSAYSRVLFAMERGDAETVAELLKDEPDVVYDGDRRGYTLLQHAIWNTSNSDDPTGRKMLRLLLDAGADPNEGEAYDSDILYWTQDRQTLEWLLQAGMSQFKRDLALIRLQMERSEYDETFSLYRPFDWLPPDERREMMSSERKQFDERIAILRKHGAGFDPNSPVWRKPVGRSLRRLITPWQPATIETETGWIFKQPHTHRFGFYHPIYAGVWQEGDEKRLVLTPSARFCEGVYASLFVFDQYLNLIRAGNTAAYNYGMYALVEVRSKSEKLPESWRGRWMLALATIDYRQRINISEPIRFVPHQTEGYDFEEQPVNTFPIALIDWNGDEIRLPRSRRDLLDDDASPIGAEPKSKQTRILLEWRSKIKAADIFIDDLTDLEIRIAEPEHDLLIAEP